MSCRLKVYAGVGEADEASSGSVFCSRFSLGVPLFQEARIPLKDGKVFVVKMKDGGKEHPYVQRVTLNGKPVKTPFIDYADIMSGAELVFEMGDKKTVFWKQP